VGGGIWRCGLGEKEPRKERGGNVHYDAVRSFSYHVDTFVVGRNVEMLHDGFVLIFLALQLPFVRPYLGLRGVEEACVLPSRWRCRYSSLVDNRKRPERKGYRE
jgi:hypothetical protein